MPLIFDDDVERIHLPDGNWVDVKRGFSKADRNFATRKSLKVRGNQKAGGGPNDSPEIQYEMDGPAFNEALMERAIKSWSFIYAEKPVPITPENIGRLDEETYDFIVDKINSFLGRTEEEKKD